MHRGEPTPTVLVVGCGYVGEQLVAAFSRAYNVFALDVSAARREILREQYAGNINVTVIGDVADSADARDFDLALISVPTLLEKDGQSVNTNHIKSAVEVVTRYAKPYSTVVVESSVTVGMTRNLLSDLRKRNVFVGFSPERVDPGRTFPAFEDIPKVISGIDSESLERVQFYYDRIFARTVPTKSMETAEFTKLFENCQRLMLITYVNEMADACALHGVDIQDVCQAAASKPFGYTPFTPSLGAGGHCIPVNPYYLLVNNDLPLLRHAAESNKERAYAKAEEIAGLAKKISSLKQNGTRSAAGRVLIYGVGFKKGSDCLSHSPSLVVADELARMGVDVAYVDDAVEGLKHLRIPSETLQRRVPGAAEGEEEYLLDASFDVVVVAHKPDAPHRAIFDQLRRTQVVYFAK
ncbi:nucleotide sugar dehydrogenase [Jaminaea rosea]|uniref:Nucleotide sugar dehydrogenase n=1 Tax=Jaminaea rosea TaxID=1569628 RepID=A0A316UWN0_9BASI|nr:nucleotide sugar dehydrogenase [Jaminaea rosea]PWN27525.1 nucleotide sugar dehydrogenase [Jaminaea rosea]